MFSVIIPVYNKEHCIERTLQSVIAQTFSDFELIIVNDGSEDESLRVIQSIHDSRIRVFSKKNEGVSIARNYGIERASHEFICFLDADDEWQPNFLSAMREVVLQFPESSFFSCPFVARARNKNIENEYMIDGIGDMFTIDDFCKSFLDNKHSPCCVGSVCVRKSLLIKCGMFPIGVKKGEDHDLWMRLACKEKLVYTTLTRMIYNLDTENNSRGSYRSYKDSFPYWVWYNYPYPVKSSLYKLTTYFLLSNALHAFRYGKLWSAYAMLKRIRLYKERH